MNKDITALQMIEFNDTNRYKMLVEHSFLVVEKITELKELHLTSREGDIDINVTLSYEKQDVLEKDYNALLKAYAPAYGTEYEEGNTKTLYRNLYCHNILEL